MRIYDDGEEFYVEDWEKWIEYQPKVGTIIEVDGSSTDQSFPPGLWLAFVVMKVQLDVDSSVILEAKFVGSEEPEINKELSLLFNRKRGFIHLCAGKPCLSDAEVSLHVTRFRVYSVEGYKKDFLTASMTRQMKKWAGMPADGPIEPEGTTASTRKPARKAREKPGKALAPAPGEDGDTGATGRLGARLQELRTRLHKARPSKTVVAEPKLLLRRKFKLCVGNAGDRNGTCRHQTGDMDLEADQSGSEESVEGESTQDPNQGPWQPSRRSGRRKEPTGFKRWYLERDAVTAGSESRSGGQRKSPRKGSNPKVFRKLSGEEVDQVVDRQDLQKRQRIFQRQAEEEEKEGTSEESETGSGWPGRWTDGELRQQLQYRLGEREGFAVRGRAGAPVEEESQATSGIGVEDAAVPCQGTTGSELKGGVGAEFESGYHIWGETYELLRDMCEADAPTEHGGPEGSSSLELGHRPTPAGRPHATWRLSGFKVRRHSPGCSGWRMASGKTLRALPHGRWRSSQQCSASRDSTARQVGSKSSGPRLSQSEGPGKRKRKEGKERTMGVLRQLRERRRKEREGRQRTLQRRMVSRGPQQVERFQGERGRQEVAAAAIPFDERVGAGHFARALLGMDIDSAGLVFDEVILQCKNFKCTGCVLAWMTIRGRSVPDLLLDALGFPKGIHQMLAAKTKEIAPRKKGASFPLREGELSSLVLAMTSFTLKDAVTPSNVEVWTADAWRFLIFSCLNHLHTGTAGLSPGRWGVSDRTVAASIGNAVARRTAHDHEGVMTWSDWQKDLGGKLVGYGGEEISRCLELSLEQVLPSLPHKDHGGSIEAIDWVGHRTREFLLNPKLVLKKESDVVLPRMPGKIHMKPSDRVAIGTELIDRNICEWIDLDRVYKVGNTPILNGLFGVEKPSKLADGRAILRLIMNLTGSNSTQEQLEGTTSSLPSITSWQSIFLEGNESLALHQSDMSSAFYLFRLPRVWLPYLAFAVVVSGADIDRDPRKKYALACKVLPMGWLSSVGIMQEISENILKRKDLSALGQVAKMKPLPHWFNEILDTARSDDKSWWHVYLDNFACGERITPADPASCAAECHKAAEEAWSEAGIVSSAKKKVSGADRITELGAEINGVQKTLGASSERLLKVVQSTLWWLKQRSWNRKHLQIIAGRWIFILQFRRPAMVALDWVWKAISGKQRLTESLKCEVRKELFLLICLSPLLHCHLGADIPNLMTASDASEKAGAVGFTTDLTQTGQDYLAAALRSELGYRPAPILIISLFNGIGGAFRCYDVAGILPMGRIAVECDKAANRITSRTWPGVEIVLDVRKVDAKLVKQWSLKYTSIEEIHTWAGFPCVDLSAVKFGRENLQGKSSKLYWEIDRIVSLLREHFGDTVTIKKVLENVASMDMSAALEISEHEGAKPFLVDPVQAVPMRRPRYCWTSETLDGIFSDVHCTAGKYWVEVSAMAPYPESNQWLTEGYWWNGDGLDVAFPTCMKSIPRSRPPPKPAGLAKCSADCISRWEADNYRFPPYQYDWKYLIMSETKWRLINADERELLLGYGHHHTRLAMSASEVKSSATAFEDKRLSMLGDSFSIYSFVIFAVACSKNFLPAMSYKHLVQRMGLAPGFKGQLRMQAPLCKQLRYGTPIRILEKYPKTVSDFNRFLLRRTNHTGSDVRIATGDVLAPKQYPRQSVSSQWWNWEEAFTTKWQKKEHINILELRAILLSLQYQTSRHKIHDARVFHISDSYICISIVSKGRSGSRLLGQVLKKISAHCLAFGLYVVLAHVDSLDNPTDEGSRR